MKKIISIILILLSFSTYSYSQCEEIIFTPNAFTPNSDKLNDIWYPEVKLDSNGLHQDFQYKLTIYDRNYQEKLFESDDPKRGWDGIDKSNGVYIYHIIVKYQSYTCEKIGTVTLIK